MDDKIRIYNPWMTLGLFVTGNALNDRIKALGLTPEWNNKDDDINTIAKTASNCTFIMCEKVNNSPGVIQLVEDIEHAFDGVLYRLYIENYFNDIEI